MSARRIFFTAVIVAFLVAGASVWIAYCRPSYTASIPVETRHQ